MFTLTVDERRSLNRLDLSNRRLRLLSAGQSGGAMTTLELDETGLMLGHRKIGMGMPGRLTMSRVIPNIRVRRPARRRGRR